MQLGEVVADGRDLAAAVDGYITQMAVSTLIRHLPGTGKSVFVYDEYPLVSLPAAFPGIRARSTNDISDFVATFADTPVAAGLTAPSRDIAYVVGRCFWAARHGYTLRKVLDDIAPDEVWLPSLHAAAVEMGPSDVLRMIKEKLHPVAPPSPAPPAESLEQRDAEVVRNLCERVGTSYEQVPSSTTRVDAWLSGVLTALQRK